MPRTCPTCRRAWDDDATFCGACGDRLPTPTTGTPAWHPSRRLAGALRARSWGPLAIVGVAAAALAAGGIALSTALPDRSPDASSGEVDLPTTAAGEAEDLVAPPTPPELVCDIGDRRRVPCVRWAHRVAPGTRAVVAHRQLLTIVGERLQGRSLATGELWWEHILDAPVIAVAGAGPRLVAATTDSVQLLDAEDGLVRWSRDVFDGPVQLRVADDLVFVHSVPDGPLRALDLATGELQWERDVTGPVDEGLVGAAVVDRPGRSSPNLGGDPGATVVGVDPEDGGDRWRTDVPTGARLVRQSGLLVTTATSTLLTIDQDDGRVAWEADRRAREAPIRQVDPIDDSDIVVTMTATGIAHGRDATSGTQRWRQDAGGGAGAYGVADSEHVSIWAGEHLHLRDRSSGELLALIDGVRGLVMPEGTARPDVLVHPEDGWLLGVALP